MVEEQAALRRVATMVAGGALPEEVFATVSAEVGRLLEADFTILSRYDQDGAATVVGTWARPGASCPLTGGTRFEHSGHSVHRLVFDTGRPARIDDYRDSDASGPAADFARSYGFRAVVGVPISVEGRLWGVMNVASARALRMPEDAESRLAAFTELMATALANAQARVELRRFADEQAALRRVATLVARAAPPNDVFAAVSGEAGLLLGADFTMMTRFDPDGAASIVGGWAKTDPGRPLLIGTRWDLSEPTTYSMVFRTGRPARIDHIRYTSAPASTAARDWGFRSAIGAPIHVDCRLWGALTVASVREEPLPSDTEERLAGFTELVGTAVANAEARAALTASRARIFAAADNARRRIERDLHDGAQQRLVSLALRLRAAQDAVSPEATELATQLDSVAQGLTDAFEELREIARGLHPPALAEGGLRLALKGLTRRSPIAVGLEVGVEGRLPEPVELAAYYVVAEALTNAAKHADATVVDVRLEVDAGSLHVHVRDDGRGGADAACGSGLIGLTDRVVTLGGHLSLHSPPGAGTTLEVDLPLGDPGPPG
jgi:signal transduction histidine kinase